MAAQPTIGSLQPLEEDEEDQQTESTTEEDEDENQDEEAAADTEEEDNQEKGEEEEEEEGNDGELSSSNNGEISCSICLEAWTSGGEHQICCLPCGHIYGMSCINHWLRRHRNSRKCPQCNSKCTLKDIRKLYASQLVVVDKESQKEIQFVGAKCTSLERMVGCTESLAEKLKQTKEVRKAGIDEEAFVAKICEGVHELGGVIFTQTEKIHSLCGTIDDLCKTIFTLSEKIHRLKAGMDRGEPAP